MNQDRFDYLEIGKPPPPSAQTAPFVAPALKAVQIIGGPGVDLGEFNTPCGLAVDGYGNLYVADTNNHRVQKITPDGEVYGIGLPRGQQGPGALSAPIAVAVDNLMGIYVLEHGAGRISKFDPVGRFVECFSAPGEQIGFLKLPRGMFRDDLGRLYVADTGNRRVQVFDSRGKFLDILGGVLASGNVAGPQAVTMDREHRIWVADGANHRLLIFNSSGGRIGSLGSPGDGPGQLYDPTGIVVTPDDSVVVAEHGNGRVSVLGQDGTLIAAYRATAQAARLDAPHALALARDESLYVSDTINHRILKLEYKGGAAPSLRNP